ncbi:MAG TPA: hypothetical protein HPP66_11065 [Planctomycetes bacterium]|nr:hypothetical protein [Planctomycetota bacterium]
MAKNNFRLPKFYELEIVNEKSRVVGKIRIKPNGILWKSRSSRDWLGVNLETFTAFMKEKGMKLKH